MTNCVAKAVSRKQIRAFTKYIRKLCNMEDVIYFPVIKFLELILPKVIDDFTLEIVEYANMPEKEGETFPSCNIIRIREDVYEKAVKGDGRARFTILHEIGHLLLHDNENVALCRTSPSSKIKAYENPEWQADAFAGELLMAEHLIKDMSVVEICQECRASYAAAQCQYNQIRK